MTQTEALKLALEALESSRIFVTSREKIKHPEGTDWYDERIAAIKKVLAQPKQEPVAWLIADGEDLWATNEKNMMLDYPKSQVTPLYTEAPQRTWVGLTDEEINQLWANNANVVGFGISFETIRAVEAKLKEKNHGT